MEDKFLDDLEALLSLTERFKGEMTTEELREWQRISAETANQRQDDAEFALIRENK